MQESDPVVAALRTRLGTEHPGIGNRDGTDRSETEGVGVELRTGCGILNGAGTDLGDQFIAALRGELPANVREFETFGSDEGANQGDATLPFVYYGMVNERDYVSPRCSANCQGS